MLKELARREFESTRGFDGHSRVWRWEENNEVRGFIAFHRENHGHPAFGATRLWPYRRPGEALVDALCLSRTMSYKAALAGIPAVGAKAVLLANHRERRRRGEFLKRYAEVVNQLGGLFITGADVGISQDDLKLMAKTSPYFVGLKTDPVAYTALGLLGAIETCLQLVFGRGTVRGRSLALQGLGKIGGELLRLVYPKAVTVCVADIDRRAIAVAKHHYPRIKVVSSRLIHREKVDVFCPCALSGALTRKNATELNAKIVVGGANDQLADSDAGDALWRRRIIYGPDYVVNAGGLIAVFDEYRHSRSNRRRVIQKIAGIKTTLKKILNRSRVENRSPERIADQLAENIFNGHR